ncbi:glycosyltransferase 87 family protein [Dactylosporangium sp. CA-092794]|uniref:glycosyltransferase 87 family protein n=1 Tax=Dactylosporangium sp. CA-092794 TaxID=3239929 RepID=UPI003D94D1F1
MRRIALVGMLATLIGVAIAVLPGHRGWFDVSVYHEAVWHWVHGGGLYDWTNWHGYGFTYPPFAALCMLPMAALPWHLTIVVNLLVTVVASVFVLALLINPVARRAGWRRWYAFALAACAFASLNAVRDTVSFGQINLVLVALVYFDLWLLERHSRWAGVGIGLAAAIKLTPLIFIGYLLITRRRRAAATATGTLLAATGVAALTVPGATRTYFTDAMWNTSRIGDLAYISNQSLQGLVARLNPAHPSKLLWLALVGAALVVWLVRVRAAGTDTRAGFALTGILGCLISPVTWVHHLVWLVPALIVMIDATLPRTGASRRRRWPAAAAYVILVSSVVWLFADLHGPIGFFGANAYTLVAAVMLVRLPLGTHSPETPAGGPSIGHDAVVVNAEDQRQQSAPGEAPPAVAARS